MFCSSVNPEIYKHSLIITNIMSKRCFAYTNMSTVKDQELAYPYRHGHEDIAKLK